MDIGVQVRDALLVPLDGVREGGDALCVAGISTSTIVCGAALCAVAVDVHVCELAAGALDVENVVVCYVVATVGECWASVLVGAVHKGKAETYC